MSKAQKVMTGVTIILTFLLVALRVAAAEEPKTTPTCQCECKSCSSDTYYTNDGKTSCLPTIKLQKALSDWNGCDTELKKARIDYSTLLKEKEIDVKAESSKCNNLIETLRLENEELNQINANAKAVTYVASGVAVAAIAAATAIYFLK